MARQKTKLTSGQLASTSLEEQQALTGQQAPTSPAQAAGIGATPDQAKMVGSKAQKTSALRSAIQGQSDLATRERLEGPRTVATEAEKQKVAGATKAQGLGDLQSRVQQIAEAKLQTGLQAGLRQAQPLQAADQTNQSLLDKLSKNPQDQAALRDLSNQLGREATEADVASLVGNQAQAAGTAAAKSVSDSISGSDLDPNTKQTAADLLGHDVSGMTLSQIEDEIQSAIQAEYSQTDALQNKLSDPYLGAAERAEARKQLRDLGAVGVKATESDMEQLADKLESADTLQFGGQDIPLDKLLSDDYVAGLVQNYLADPNSESSKLLRKNEPDLVKLVDQYKPLMDAAVKNLGAGVAEYAATQQANRELAKIDVGSGQQLNLSDDVMKSIYPDWGSQRASKYNRETSGFLQTLADSSIATQDKQAMIDLAEKYPEFRQAMTHQSASDLKTFFAGPEKQNVQDKLNQYNLVKQLDDKNPYPNSVAQVLGFTDQSELESQLGQAMQVAKSQGKLPELLANLEKSGITLDKAGKLDWAATIRGIRTKSPSTLADIQNTGIKTLSRHTQQYIRDYVDKAPKADKVVGQVAGPAGILKTDAQVKEVAKTLVDVAKPKDSAEFLQTAAYKKLDEDKKQTYQNSIRTAVNRDVTTSIAKKFPGVTDINKFVDKLSKTQDVTPSEDTVNNLRHVIQSIENDIDVSHAAGNVVMEGQQRKLRDLLRDTTAKYEARVQHNQAFSRKVAADDANNMTQVHLNMATPKAAVDYIMNHSKLTPEFVTGVERSIRDLTKASKLAESRGATSVAAEYRRQLHQMQQAYEAYNSGSRGIDRISKKQKKQAEGKFTTQAGQAAVGGQSNAPIDLEQGTSLDIVNPDTGMEFTR